MKNCETLISLLIVVGISSLTTAQPHIPTEDEWLPNPSHSPPTQASATPEDMKIWFEEKCNRNGGPGAFESAMKLPQGMEKCMKSVVDVGELQVELAMASRRNNLATVFKKYCKKASELEQCLLNMKNTVAPCFDPEENEDLKISDKITSAVLEYICYNDGERTTTLMTAGGPACIQNNRRQIQICADDNLGHYSSLINLSSHPLMNLGPEKCSNLEKFKTCATRSLETCPDSKTAEIFEGLFSFVRKVTPCEELLDHTSTVPPIDVEASQKPTGDFKDVSQEQKPVKSHVTVEELMKKSLVKQIEAAEAQVRAANAQELAAVAQEQAARVVEQVGKTWLRKNPTNPFETRNE